MRQNDDEQTGVHLSLTHTLIHKVQCTRWYLTLKEEVVASSSFLFVGGGGCAAASFGGVGAAAAAARSPHSGSLFGGKNYRSGTDLSRIGGEGGGEGGYS